MSNAAEGTRTLVIEKFLAHPPEKVWRALTESQLLAQWLMNNDFRPSVGDKFQFRSQPVPNWSGIIDCEVLIVEPLRRLSYTWGTLGIDTAVLWILTPAEGGTLLRAACEGERGREPERARKRGADAHRVINLDHCAFRAVSKVGQARS